MNKAEEKALEAYPRELDFRVNSNVDRRIGYRQGYEQALTDIEKFAESLTANAHEMPNENPEKAKYEGWDSAIQQVFDYINDLKD